MSTDSVKRAVTAFMERNRGKAPKPARKRSSANSGGLRTEYQEQMALCDWLKLHGIVYCSVPNGALLGGEDRRITAARLKRVGLKPGVPDILIFTPPPVGGFVGCALELKRAKGGRLSPAQDEWLHALHGLGWACRVGHGAKDAIEQLVALGYGSRQE